MDYRITEKLLGSYEEHLIRGEYARGSIEKYLRDIRAFLQWAGERALSREEYERLLRAAHRRENLRLELLLETICATKKYEKEEEEK